LASLLWAAGQCLTFLQWKFKLDEWASPRRSSVFFLFVFFGLQRFRNFVRNIGPTYPLPSSMVYVLCSLFREPFSRDCPREVLWYFSKTFNLRFMLTCSTAFRAPQKVRPSFSFSKAFGLQWCCNFTGDTGLTSPLPTGIQTRRTSLRAVWFFSKTFNIRFMFTTAFRARKFATKGVPVFFFFKNYWFTTIL